MVAAAVGIAEVLGAVAALSGSEPELEHPPINAAAVPSRRTIAERRMTIPIFMSW